MLIFIGGKIFYAQIWGKLDPAISLGVTFTLLTGGVVVSLLGSRTGNSRETPPLAEHSAAGQT